MTKISEAELRTARSEAVLELQGQLKEKERLLNVYKKSHGKMELFFDAMRSAIKPIKPLPLIYEPTKNKKPVDTPITAVMRISDGHMGEVVEPKEIEGFNVFNPEICRARQVNYAKDFCDWVDVKRYGYHCHDVVVIVTGDLISGDIHHELQVTNAFPVPVQIVRAAEVLAEQLAVLSQNFRTVTVEFIVADNHSRKTLRPQASQEGWNSENYLVGKMAEAYTEKLPNIIFNIYPMHEKVVTVAQMQYLIAHGHGVLGWMGTPHYGIERKVSREAQARLQLIMEEASRMKEIGFHKYIIGHWHIEHLSTSYAICPSVSGTSAYDHQKGRYSRPGQTSWMIHPKWGEFDWINFRLTG